MKHPRIKAIVSVAILCLIIPCLTLGYAVFNTLSDDKDASQTTAMKLEGIKQTLSKQPDIIRDAMNDFADQLGAKRGLFALPLRQIAREQGEAVLRSYEDGLVLRRDDDGIVLPDGAVNVPILEPVDYPDAPAALTPCSPFKDLAGNFWSRLPDAPEDEYVLCTYCLITGRYYYLHYIPASEVEDYFDARLNFFDSLAENAQHAYGGYLLSFSELDGALPLLYYPTDFGVGERDASEFGISPDVGLEFTQTTIDGEDYMYVVSDPFTAEGIDQIFHAAYMVPADEYYERTMHVNTMMLVVASAFMLVLIVWVLAVIKLIRREKITASQRKRYAPGRMRLVALSVGVIGLAAVLLVSMFSDALSQLYYSTQTSDAALETLRSMATENQSYADKLAEERTALYVDYARRIAEMLGAYPDLRDDDTLWELNEIIGSDYLMIYDRNGRETFSSTQFLNLEYGTTPESSTYDFRRLSTGVTSIVHDACVDEVTGLNRQLIGVAFGDGNDGKGYDSLIVALQPADTAAMTTEDFMNALTPTGSLMMAIDKETGTVLHASEPNYAGKRIYDLGMAEGSLREDFMDFFTLDGARWYGCINEYDGVIYLCAERTEGMFNHILRDGLCRGAMFFIAYLLLAAVLLSGVTERAIHDYGAVVVEDHELLPPRPADSDRLSDRIVNWWHRKTPERKAWVTLRVLMGISLALFVVQLRRRNNDVGEFAIISYVLNGHWQQGVNLFALTRIVFIFVVVALCVLALDMLIGLICGMIDTKGETICRLTGSLIKYAAVLVGLFFAFESLGFDTRTLLASVGVFSLAVSLGAKDLVSDVLSGLTIVFSGEYQIDDIVEIGGFRGKVWEIGVRSTTLVNEEGAIKSISNRNVSNVMNLSRMNTVYTLKLVVGSDQPLDRVEALLRQALPEIGGRVEGLEAPPEYRGVVAMGGGGMTLAIAVTCDARNLAAVQAQLNAEVKRLFEQNNIPLR